MNDAALTVVRLPLPPRADPIEQVVSTVGRVNLALARELHEGSLTRPYAVVRRADTLDVVTGRDDLASALLDGGKPVARLVRSLRMVDLVNAPTHGRLLRVAFMTPTHFRTAGSDYLLPDPGYVFKSVVERWTALGWPELPSANFHRIGCAPERYELATWPVKDEHRTGFVGVVRYYLGVDNVSDVPLLWTLAQFAEYRGVGGHTSYGMGRVRILRPDEYWAPGTVQSVWEAARPGRITAATMGGGEERP